MSDKYLFRVILVGNGVYKKTLHKSQTRETAFMHFHKLKDENKKVMFPRKHVNSNKILPIKYTMCVIKPTESTDVFRILRDDVGRTYTEKPLGDWTIIHSTEYNIEETFWIWGMENDRPTISAVVKKLMTGAYKKNSTKQIIVVHNKLVIYNEDQFDMIICKCKLDAQRLHHTLAKISKKQILKNLLFMGTASPASVGRMYDLIKEHTKWSIEKIRRTTTRP